VKHEYAIQVQRYIKKERRINNSHPVSCFTEISSWWKNINHKSFFKHKEKIVKKFVLYLILLAIVLISVQSSLAQDANKVDPKHYKVILENEQVRVLRITYGLGEKSVMHSHPEGVVVFLTDGDSKFTFPDGQSQNIKFKAGSVIWVSEQNHLPENIGNKPFEVIQIEMKSAPTSTTNSY